MFESLSQRLSTTIERLRGRARLTEANIRESLREVRIALLEADVALPVVQALIQRVQVRAVGQEVLKSLTPGQALVKVVRDELTAVMGTVNTDLNLAAAPPAIVLMAGLQGAGKTTTVAKLGEIPQGAQEEKSHGRQLRRLSSGRDRAVAHAGRAGRRAVSSEQRRSGSGRDREVRARRGEEEFRRRAARRHRRPPRASTRR